MLKETLLRGVFIGATMFAEGCSPPAISEGTVVGKHDYPTHVTLMPIKVGKSTSWMPVVHPERWTVTIERCSIATPPAKSECQRNEVSVDSKTYESTEIGSFYRVPNR